ncbi:MAG: rRNA pseudouridine synthase [Rhodospirillales bacterium]|nr:rRNA pseudouridine synthase [Rhodospirillales bacterium]
MAKAPENETPEKGERIATTPEKGERIAKVIARAGLCSRRDAERWIADGRVVVDGKKLTSPALTVTAANTVIVDGKPLAGNVETKVWRYHKPAGLIVSHSDPEGRATIFERMPPGMPRVISVGRLDLTSEGLMLLTNNGELARHMEKPDTGWIRRYRVRVNGRIDEAALAKLEKGVTISGIRYGAIKAELDRQKGANAWVTMALTEGKNREIRKVMEHLGYRVTRLIRTAYGPFQLGNMERGAVTEVSHKMLRESLPKSFNLD